MPKTIKIIIGDLELYAELNKSSTSKTLASILPLEFTMSRWGDEYYGNCGINAELDTGSREVMEIGELAVWPVGNALCIFFGPTPASHGDEPRAASPVNPVGRLTDVPEQLKKLNSSINVKIELLQQ
ncbi:MAG: cyclophilin-like fold protein [Thermodesulfovibrionales bacterium]